MYEKRTEGGAENQIFIEKHFSTPQALEHRAFQTVLKRFFLTSFPNQKKLLNRNRTKKIVSKFPPIILNKAIKIGNKNQIYYNSTCDVIDIISNI